MKKLKIGIIDADLIGRKKHRFPNLASMKISGFHKDLGDVVDLLTSYDPIDDYDKVYVSKVFTDTVVPVDLLASKNVVIGGTGFFFDKAPFLPDEVEHHMPDYELYNDWVNEKISCGTKRSEFKEYLDYSHGFLTRYCFRKCPFCVNRNFNKVVKWSPLKEFLNNEKKKICLNDDNFFGYSGWKPLLQQLIDTGKRFKFKQGLDARLLTPDRCSLLFSAKYDKNITFAFDDISDYDIIHKKLKLIRDHTDRECTFYVFCGFDRNGKYDDLFWQQDIKDVFSRINLLREYHMCPYIMRHKNYKDATKIFYGMYVDLARWCNQFSFFKRNTLREFCRDVKSNGVTSAAYRYMDEYEKKYPYISEEFDKKIIW